MNLATFKTIYHEHKRRNTTLPPHAVPAPTFNDKTEKGLKEAIKAYAKYKGWGFLTYDAKGRKLPNGKWAYSHMTKGAPDCILFVPKPKVSRQYIHEAITTAGANTRIRQADPALVAQIIARVSELHEATPTTIVVHVEIKMPGDRQKDHQKAFQEAAEARGERYIMPKNWITFYQAIEAYSG